MADDDPPTGGDASAGHIELTGGTQPVWVQAGGHIEVTAGTAVGAGYAAAGSIEITGTTVPPPGLGITVPLGPFEVPSGDGASSYGADMGPGRLSPGPLPVGLSDSFSTAEAESLEVTIPGGPVLGLFLAVPDRIDQLLEVVDEETIVALTETLQRLAPFANAEGSAEERWRQFLTSAVGDAVRKSVEPILERIELRQTEMDSLFAQVFELHRSMATDGTAPFETEPSAMEVRSWSAVVMFWIATAAAGYWIGSDPQIGVILTAIVSLVFLYDRCFR